MPWIELAAQRRPAQPPAGMQPPENARDWFRIENSVDDVDTTDVYVYDSIGGWFGMWADEFVDQLKAVTTSKINLRLNSPGGSVFDGIAIANAIRTHPATVTVYVDSLAASIASVIAMAGDRLVMMPQSQIMVHNASGACYGDASEMTKMADLLDKQSRNIAEAYAQHTGGSLADWQQYMADETWFTADEAVAVGLADEAMPMKPKKSDEECTPMPAEARMHRSWDLSMYRYAGREQAPAPTAAKLLTGTRIAASVINGIDLTGDIADVAPAVEPKDVPGITPGTITIDFGQLAIGGPNHSFDLPTFMDAIRSLVREEIAGAAPPFLPKKGEGDEEDDDDEKEEDQEPQPGDSLTAVPPAGDAPPTPVNEDPPEGVPPDGAASDPTDQADEWAPIVGLLHAPTSPSADDVFAQLKEGW